MNIQAFLPWSEEYEARPPFGEAEEAAHERRVRRLEGLANIGEAIILNFPTERVKPAQEVSELPPAQEAVEMTPPVIASVTDINEYRQAKEEQAARNQVDQAFAKPDAPLNPGNQI